LDTHPPLLFQPSNQETQLLKSSYRIGTLAVLAIVALRLAIGWHFFREGADKLVSGNFSSAGFMVIAKGPLTPLFHWFVWDLDGRVRLDREGTLEAWNQYREQVVAHFGFDDKQAAKAKEAQKLREQQFTWLLDENAEDIDKYFQGLERRDRYRADASRTEVASLRDQLGTIEQDLTRDRNSWLGNIDTIWKGLENDLNALATPEQAARGDLALGKPGRKLMDTVFIDQIIPTFDLVVGILLILGLFTRITSLAGAGFLAMIVATQWPGAPGAVPAHYQTIEMFGCLVLAAVGAGRFAGLDFLVGCLLKKCCPPKTEKK
jgi:uncharacterized membrane protein YphA (DoxX/SURF4 family)